MGKECQPVLAEVDGLEIAVIVNDEVDYISPTPNPAVIQSGQFQSAPLSAIVDADGRGGAKGELRMSNLCSGALGLSLLITVTKDGKGHSMLFDAGPEDGVWARNATRLRLDLSPIEHIHLSHWHRDHSGGLVRAVSMITAARGAESPRVIVEVHPSRPDFRGALADCPISLEADPTLEEIVEAGAVLKMSTEVHTVLEGKVLVSGEIPRMTDYELGLPRGLRYSKETGRWEEEHHLMDEWFVTVNLKGKALVVVTGCSHAGVVNVARHAIDLGDGVPLYAVVGGYHLADGKPEKLQASMQDLKALEPKILMPGHCTGWRFKYMIEQDMPGSVVPLFGGVKYTFNETTGSLGM